MLDFVKLMVNDASIDSNGVRVGLMTFSSNPKVIFNMNEITNKKTLLERIGRVPYEYGNTNTADAIRALRTQMFTIRNGDREGIRNVAVLLTDGVSNVNNQLVALEAKRARDDGIQMIAIGINLNSLTELDSIASDPVEYNRFSVNSFNQLAAVKTDLFPSTCEGIIVMHK